MYWTIISPLFRPGSGVRNAGSPPLSRGSTSSAVRRSEIAPSSASASFAKSSASAIGSPWKLPPLITSPPPVASASAVDVAAGGEHERVVGRGVELDVEHPPEVVERVADRAVDLRHAAQRVRVLDLVRRRVVRALEPESRSRWRSSAATAIWPGCGRASWYGAANATSVPSSASTLHRRGDATRSASAGPRRRASSAPSARHQLGPVEEGEALLRLERQRLEAALAERDERGTTCPPTSTWPRPMSGSARCASGARSPDAPTLPCSGTTGWMPELAGARRADRRAAAGSREWPERERVRPQQEHRADDLARERRADARPRARRAGSPGARPRPPGGMNVDREVAEPGRHAVDDLAARDERVDDVARLLHPLAGVDVERGAGAVAGDRLHVGDREVRARQDDEVGPLGRPGRPGTKWASVTARA